MRSDPPSRDAATPQKPSSDARTGLCRYAGGSAAAAAEKPPPPGSPAAALAALPPSAERRPGPPPPPLRASRSGWVLSLGSTHSPESCRG